MEGELRPIVVTGGPNPDLTPEQQLMVEIGWLELWRALREESAGEPGATREADT